MAAVPQLGRPTHGKMSAGLILVLGGGGIFSFHRGYVCIALVPIREDGQSMQKPQKVINYHMTQYLLYHSVYKKKTHQF